LYDKPLFAGTAASAIYRPSKNISGGGDGIDGNPHANDDDDDDESGNHASDRERVRNILGSSSGRPNKGFSGAKDAPERDGPVQFEKEIISSKFATSSSSAATTSDDPFGLDAFLTEASGRGRKAMDHIGKSSMGHMSINAGGTMASSSATAKKRVRHDSDDEQDDDS
jgi:hypothetical protein